MGKLLAAVAAAMCVGSLSTALFAEKQAIVTKGEIIDMDCYKKGAGDAYKSCTKAGKSIGILTVDGTPYELKGDKLAPHMGHMVQIIGDLVGSNTIQVTDLTMLKNQPAKK